MSKKTYVIDTNVFLHDPQAIQTFENAEIAIPLPVLEELDGLKRITDERGKNARSVIRYISSLKSEDGVDLNRGVEIENGNLLKVIAAQKPMEKGAFPLPMEKENIKLLMAFQLALSNPNVVFLSKDLVMRVKAEAIGLKSQDYENLKFSYEGLYKGYQKMTAEKAQIDLFFKDGFMEAKFEEGIHPNEYCLMTSPEKSSAVARFNASKNRLEPLLKISQDIWGILPLNLEQKCALDLLLRDDIKLVTLVGPAGTGKTLLTLAAAMRKVFDEGLYSRILVSRPIVPLGKDIGYLPGTKEEKLIHWMQPIYDNLEFLCSSGSGNGESETLDYITESGKIEMEAVTYIRGRSLPKMFIIIDEAQNLTPHEVKTIISRAGQGTKVVLTGDPTQIDNPYLDKDSNGLTFTVNKFADHPLFGHMFLERTERSELAALAAEIL